MKLFDTRETCRFCHGTRCETYRTIALQEPCRKCKGSGKLHWIENLNGSVTRENVDGNIEFHLAQKNVMALVYEIKEVFRRLGKEAVVTIEEFEPNFHPDPYIYRETAKRKTILKE